MAARTNASATPSPDRGQVLQAGRDAAAARRRADSQRCRDRVAEVIESMQRSRTPLSDAEITRRARVNGQYLQRHRDLKARAATIRADLEGDAARAAVAGRLPDADATVEHLRKERDEALAALRSAEADLAALRNLNQRLMVENSRLLQATEQWTQ